MGAWAGNTRLLLAMSTLAMGDCMQAPQLMLQLQLRVPRLRVARISVVSTDAANANAAAEVYEIPLFDPLQDEIPFPFPVPSPHSELGDEPSGPKARTYRYAFDRPAHLRMLREGVPEGDGNLFGHLVYAGDGEAVNPL